MERKPYSGSGQRGSSAPRRPGSAPQARASQGRSPSRPPSGRAPQEPRRRPAPPRYPEAPRRAPVRKKRRRRSAKDVIPLLMLLCAVAAVAYFFLQPILTVRANEDTFCDNVFVNGVELDQFDRATGEAVVQETLYQRLNKTFTLTHGNLKWSFKPADFGASIDAAPYLERAWNIGHVGSTSDKSSAINALKKTPVHFDAPLQYNAELIDAFLDPIAEAVYVAPVDAQVTLDIDRPYLSGQSSKGLELDREAAKALICSLIETGVGDTALPVKDIEPAVSSDSAAGGMNVIVQFSTDTTFRRSDARANIRKALGYFNAMAVYPGDTVNFNDVVGPRTEERGFKKATEYAGNTTQEGIGGGVCQASTTLYCAAMLAGMDIIERHNHSMTVSYTEPSLDAAVTDTNHKNFIFQNNTEHAIYIYTEVDREFATVTIYGNRAEYRYELQSVIVSQDAECSFNTYLPDEDGKHCYYTTETKLHTAGHPALQSEGWLVAYDWETGEQVKRSQLSFDIYESGTNIYWRGIHDPATGEKVDYSDW